ncbi:hypothetical protein KR50_33010 [Jeotgalibacillus campisalis]|uniref:Uncharacterized protein n=1 Tax=Jeotgalibacillus campisalis TaxID=220754 RepID=A0A0C2VGY8_9BACL|nr:hypothetical protein KR50_33010 [Jeotgalibacillus campisalis]
MLCIFSVSPFPLHPAGVGAFHFNEPILFYLVIKRLIYFRDTLIFSFEAYLYCNELNIRWNHGFRFMISVILIFIFKWDRFISVPGARFLAGREVSRSMLCIFSVSPFPLHPAGVGAFQFNEPILFYLVIKWED